MYVPIKRQIPNFFTLGNLSFGVLSILAVFRQEYETAVIWVIAAAVLDVFDGFLARLLKVSGELGKQLDSLADMVTFGVAPGFMLFMLSEPLDSSVRYFFLLIPVFSCYRLAKFNIDTRQTNSFIGVPTPITGIMCMSWGCIDDPYREFVFENPWVFALFCTVVSLLLVSRLRLPSLKFKKGPARDYTKHVVLLCIGVASLLFWGWLCVPVFYAAYVMSAVTNIFKRPSQD